MHHLKLLLLAVFIAFPPGADAQQVRLAGSGEEEIDARISAALASPTLEVISRDTLLAAGDTLLGPVLVLGRTMTVEGVIVGDLIAIDANVFLRPSAVVTGDVVNASGGLYPSTLARVHGTVIDRPLARYSLNSSGDTYTIVSRSERRGPLRLDGIRGLHIPTYDRVNGLGLDFGARYQIGEDSRGPYLHGVIGYRTERGELTGGADLSAPVAGLRAFAGAERAVFTNEEWIRRDLTNTVSYLLKGSDYRDYYQADRVFAGVEREDTILRRSTLRWAAGWQLEDATSLRADDPWSVFKKDSIRPNLPVSDGRIGSARFDAQALLIGSSSAVELNADVEVASEALGGSHEFARFRFFGEFGMAALSNHRLEVEWMASAPIGTDSLPLQRWSFVGGSGTVHTREVAEFRGDRIAFVETAYVVPFPERWALRLLGVPTASLIHAAGMAWTHRRERDLVQEFGVRLDARFVYVRVLVDPDDTGNPKLTVGVTLPDPAPRWER